LPTARHQQVNLINTAYYHCVSRCVRRAFLCGKDKHSGQSYEHRRQWVEDRIHLLSTVFAIDVCSYAVMSNHTHAVLRINRQQALEMSDIDVITRWHSLHKGTLLTHRVVNDMPLTDTEIETVKATVKIWRERLYSISWFMRELNEYIARLANKEDDCTGRFWEGRFSSQALMGRAAVTACMAYVDLNPIRAGMARTPERSAHTSIQYRINALKACKTPTYLLAFTGDADHNPHAELPFTLHEYLELVDITGRQIRQNKPGYIDNNLPSILQRLNIKPAQFVELATTLEDAFSRVVGDEAQLLTYQANQGLQRMRNKAIARRLFG